MKVETSVIIDCPPDRVWPVLIDVERWPEWTASVTAVERLDKGEFGPGSQARIRQPRVPTAIWRVTEIQPGQSFTWEAKNTGLKSVATHTLQTNGQTTIATLTFVQTGWLARLVQPWAEPLARQYITMEAQGLRRKCQT